MATVEDRVASGVYMLDIFSPGWRQKIDLANLDITSCRDCVLGQIYGSYETGMRRLGLWWDEDDKQPAEIVNPGMLGFSFHDLVHVEQEHHGADYFTRYHQIERIQHSELLNAWAAQVAA